MESDELGAIGAFLLHQPTWASWSRRGSMEHNESPKLNRTGSKSQRMNGMNDKKDDTPSESAIIF